MYKTLEYVSVFLRQAFLVDVEICTRILVVFIQNTHILREFEHTVSMLFVADYIEWEKSLLPEFFVTYQVFRALLESLSPAEYANVALLSAFSDFVKFLVISSY